MCVTCWIHIVTKNLQNKMKILVKYSFECGNFIRQFLSVNCLFKNLNNSTNPGISLQLIFHTGKCVLGHSKPVNRTIWDFNLKIPFEVTSSVSVSVQNSSFSEVHLWFHTRSIDNNRLSPEQNTFSMWKFVEINKRIRRSF